jgi:hypothetical protein
MKAEEIQEIISRCAEICKAANPIVAAGTMQITNIMIQGEIAIRLGEIAEHLGDISNRLDNICNPNNGDSLNVTTFSPI